MTDLLKRNYFELFDLPQVFDLDIEALQHRYRQLQRATHPDRFSAQAGQQQRLAVQVAAFVNEAHQTLKNPLTRARYLLALRGVEWDDEKNTVSDPAFLMEQMDLREQLDDLKTQESVSMSKLEQLIAHIDTQIAALSRELAGCFAVGDESALLHARSLIQKWQFFNRLRDDAETLEEIF